MLYARPETAFTYPNLPERLNAQKTMRPLSEFHARRKDNVSNEEPKFLSAYHCICCGRIEYGTSESTAAQTIAAPMRNGWLE
jgi:hypothetical protein